MERLTTTRTHGQLAPVGLAALCAALISGCSSEPQPDFPVELSDQAQWEAASRDVVPIDAPFGAASWSIDGTQLVIILTGSADCGSNSTPIGLTITSPTSIDIQTQLRTTREFCDFVFASYSFAMPRPERLDANSPIAVTVDGQERADLKPVAAQ